MIPCTLRASLVSEQLLTSKVLYMGGNFIGELPIQIEFYIETKAHFREYIRNFLLFRRFSANKKMRSSPPKTRCRKGRDT